MKRIIGIVTLVLVLMASQVSAGYIEDTTLNDINSPKVSRQWRDGLLTGVFLTFMSSEAVSCRMMSGGMMIASLEGLLAAGEITGEWTVYKASLYALARAGCTATPQEKPNV